MDAVREEGEELEEAEVNSSQDDMSDKSYDSNVFQIQKEEGQPQVEQIEQPLQPEENKLSQAIHGSFLYNEIVNPDDRNR